MFQLHWARYSSSCYPCVINYDYISNFETFNDDALFILRRLGHTGNLHEEFPNLFRKKPKTTESRERAYYSQLTTEQTENLKMIYKNDFLLFGYK